MDNLQELNVLLQKANNAVNWENWELEEGDGHYKLGQVYWCKLDWIKESLNPETQEEFIYLIEDLQETICPILNLLDQN